jgi:hypothetical protein
LRTGLTAGVLFSGGQGVSPLSKDSGRGRSGCREMLDPRVLQGGVKEPEGAGGAARQQGRRPGGATHPPASASRSAAGTASIRCRWHRYLDGHHPFLPCHFFQVLKWRVGSTDAELSSASRRAAVAGRDPSRRPAPHRPDEMRAFLLQVSLNGVGPFAERGVGRGRLVGRTGSILSPHPVLEEQPDGRAGAEPPAAGRPGGAPSSSSFPQGGGPPGAVGMSRNEADGFAPTGPLRGFRAAYRASPRPNGRAGWCRPGGRSARCPRSTASSCGSRAPERR